MFHQFNKHLQTNNWFSKETPLLIAVSGGVDSVVLVYLLHKLNYNIALAHCNFCLRDEESDDDEQFCVKLADKLSLKIFTKKFNTNQYIKKHKVGIQEAARNLRYQWFNELLQKHQYKFLITAHHANDQIETFFINTFRGTGLKGLTGIPNAKNSIVRPLLPFTKKEIIEYAKSNKLKYRTDLSNLEDDYLRNFIRLQILPKIKTKIPQIETRMLQNILILQSEFNVLNDLVEDKKAEYKLTINKPIKISIKQLLAEKHLHFVTHHLFQQFNLSSTQIENIISCITPKVITGKKFNTSSHNIVIDRSVIVVEPIIKTFESIVLTSENELYENNLFKITSLNKTKKPVNTELVIDKNKLIYPLTVRNAKVGDKFVPFGMKGFKLLSDFLKDLKLNLLEKQKTLLLINGNNEIIWVIGHRTDNRFKIENWDSESLIKIKYNRR
ncbi:MAG: tRNA lysidine(34) synthetase TilS [Bacteroidetes bacterium]|nr:tRNA lysidine(34) synthetase TilS [Bacteroidota bacterium]